MNVITQLQNNVNNLQGQIAAMEAAGPPAAPPPRVPLGAAPGIIHRAVAPAPVVNLDAAAIRVAIAQALPLPTAPTTRGPMAKEPKLFDGKMENIKAFIRSCQIYIEIKQGQFVSEQVRIMWVLSLEF